MLSMSFSHGISRWDPPASHISSGTVAVGDGVAVGLSTGVGVGSGVTAGVFVGVAEGTLVGVAVGVAVGECVAVGVGVAVSGGVAVMLAVGVGVLVGVKVGVAAQFEQHAGPPIFFTSQLSLKLQSLIATPTSIWPSSIYPANEKLRFFISPSVKEVAHFTPVIPVSGS
jgi:hypothetical protein